MAALTNTQTVFGLRDTANKNNIMDSVFNNISMIDPYDAPFSNMAGEDTSTTEKFEWLTSTLNAANPNNAIVDGDDQLLGASPATDSLIVPKRYFNHMQTMRYTISISGRSEVAGKFGRKSEMKQQTEWLTKQLIRDKESACMQREVYVVSASGVAGKTRGVPGFIYTNVDPTASGSTTGLGTGGTPVMSDPWNTNTAITVGSTPRPLSEALVNSSAELAFLNGGNPDILMVHPNHKKVTDTFNGVTYSTATGGTRFFETKGATRSVTYDVYKGPYGTLTVVPNRWQAATKAFLLQSDTWDIVYHTGRKFLIEDLAKVGDSHKKQIISDFGVRCKNEKANGALHALSAAS